MLTMTDKQCAEWLLAHYHELGPFERARQYNSAGMQCEAVEFRAVLLKVLVPGGSNYRKFVHSKQFVTRFYPQDYKDVIRHAALTFYEDYGHEPYEGYARAQAKKAYRWRAPVYNVSVSRRNRNAHTRLKRAS